MEEIRLIYLQHLTWSTVNLQPLLLMATTAADIQSTLTSTYVKPSRGHVKQICQQLGNWKKGSKSIDEFFKCLTTRFAQLALLGKSLDQEDQIEHILDGLTEEYKTIADQIDGRDTHPPLTEIHEKLLNQDVKLQSVSASASSSHVIPNFTSYNGSSSNNGNNNSCRGGYRGNQSHQP